MEKDISFDNLLYVIIEEAYEDSISVKKRHEEFLQPIGHEIFFEEEYQSYYSSLFVQVTIERIRGEIKKINENIEQWFSEFPESMIESVYVQTPAERIYFTQEKWKSAEELVRSAALVDKLILFFNISSEHLKPKTAEVVSNEIFDSHHDKESGKNWVIDNIPYDKRILLLWWCGVIDKETKGRLEDVRILRNSLIHDLGTTYTDFSIDDILIKVDECVKAIEELDDFVGYPSLLTDDLSEALSKQLGVDIESLEETVGGKEKFNVSEVKDEVETAMLEAALKGDGKRNFIKKELEEQFQGNQEKQLSSYERFHEDVLIDVDSKDEWLSWFFFYMRVFRDRMGVNLMETLYENQRRFTEDHFPDGLFTESNIQHFDPDREDIENSNQ